MEEISVSRSGVGGNVEFSTTQLNDSDVEIFDFTGAKC
nr:MAG TPA: hypothetical protein [Caudoviricetes sp.]